MLSSLEASAREIINDRCQKDPASREIAGASTDVDDVYNERFEIQNEGWDVRAVGELGKVSEMRGRVRSRFEGRGLHLCLGVSERVGSPPTKRGCMPQNKIWMESCKENADSVGTAGVRKRGRRYRND